MEPGTTPQVGDEVEVDYDGKWKLGTIVSIHDSFICVKTFEFVTIPIHWYRERMGWRWGQTPTM